MNVTGNASVGGSYVGSHVPVPTAPIRRPDNDIVSRVERARSWKSPIILQPSTSMPPKEIHGTMKGVWWHRANGVPKCDECKAADRESRRQARAAAGPRAATNRDADSYQQPKWDVAAAAKDFKDGLTVRELCEKYGVSTTVMRRQLKNRHGLNAERVVVDRAAVKRLHGEGKTARDIATALGCTYSAAYKILGELDVPLNPRRRAVDPDTIRAAYAREGSITKVATSLRVGRETVRRALGMREAVAA